MEHPVLFEPFNSWGFYQRLGGKIPMKTIAADRRGTSKSQETFVNRDAKQKSICLIYHQQRANRNKQVAVNKKPENAGNKSL
jgi:hypothetical protein